MSNYVPGYGCSSAKLMAIGEAPGSSEDSSGIPFSGPAGSLLDEALHTAGIDRSQVYLTNVVKHKPPNNDLTKLHLIGRTIEEYLPQLRDEINTIRPNCILAIGNTALEALTGNKGIQKYRGSILWSGFGSCKVVPTLHPALLLHKEIAWKEFAWIKKDVIRAREQSEFPAYKPPERYLHVAYNSLDVIRFLERNSGKEKVTLDVETSKTWAQCIGLAFDSSEAISIPTFWEDIPLHDRVYIWKILAEFLADTKIKLIAQNAKFDQKRCRQLGLDWLRCWFSMDMGWHCLFPEFPKKLQFISSIITEEPYYKDEGNEYNAKVHKIDRWFLYNAKDAAVEFECSEKILLELQESGLYNWYFDRIQPLYDLYYDIEDTGILIDKEIRKHLGKKYSDLKDKLQSQLVKNIADGDVKLEESFKNFNVMSNGPKNQVAQLLFGYLKLPVRADTGDRTLKALANNHAKSQRVKDILMGILDVRGVRKTLGTYIGANLSNNEPWIRTKDRIHTTCNINGTESFRSSTGILKSPVSVDNMGIALQTMTKHEESGMQKGGGDLRSMFIADSGYSFVEIDQAQAEDRVTCVWAEDYDALKNYDKKEYKYNKHGLKDDRHTLTTMAAVGLTFDEVTADYRQIGKETRHAGNLDIGKHELMENFASHGFFISEWKCGKFLDSFHAANPKIRNVFHTDVQQALSNNNCTLTSPHGRSRTFFNKWGRDMWKEAYAHLNQSTVSDQTKFAMLDCTKVLKGYKKWWFFCLESHDSVLALVKDEIIDEYIVNIKLLFERPIDFSSCTLKRDFKLVIPTDVQVGKRWIGHSTTYPDGMKKWEQKSALS